MNATALRSHAARIARLALREAAAGRTEASDRLAADITNLMREHAAGTRRPAVRVPA